MMQKVLNQQILTTKQEVAALSGVKAQLADAQRQLAQSAAELEELRKSQLSMHADLQLKVRRSMPLKFRIFLTGALVDKELLEEVEARA